jgi:hypothetical protein
MAPEHTKERDFPLGHPKAGDYVPDSTEAREWARKNISTGGERDFPVDHIKAIDTPGNTNHLAILPGIDPLHPELEEFTGATPEVAAARRADYLAHLPAASAPKTPQRRAGDVDYAVHQSALDFLVSNGHTIEQAETLIRHRGLDSILAAQQMVTRGA